MPLEFQTALPPHVFGIPVQETPPLPRNSKMPPVVWYGYFLESPISLHLISKRIKEILTQNIKITRNIYPSLMVKMFSANKKNLCIFFQISAVFIARGGHLRIFWGGYVPPRTPNWHPFQKKISPKIDTPF